MVKNRFQALKIFSRWPTGPAAFSFVLGGGLAQGEEERVGRRRARLSGTSFLNPAAAGSAQ